MAGIKIVRASRKDLKQLLDFFKHYKVETIIKNRVNCYLSHNFTIIARDGKRIVGVLQWYVKENPNAGVVEFEETYVSEGYRGKGTGFLLVQYAIESVKNYFNKFKIKPRKIYLFVGEENKSARRLYQKHGFRLVSKTGNLFSDARIELFYCLDLH